MAIVDFQALSQSTSTSIQRMTGPQRVTLGLAVAAAAMGIFLVSRVAANTPMAPLYADLDSSTAAAIVAELDQLGVEFELDAGGQTIRVPADQVHTLRLSLSGQGLPGDGEGWSVLENQGITTSAFDQRVGYQRAMEGELSKTISAIDGVASADVHLVMPESDLLMGDDRQPTASVLLVRQGSKPINPTQVDAIVNLVASSVEGLRTDQVSVADDSGQVLAAPGEGSGVVGLQGDSQLRAKRQYEAALKADLEALLAAVVGPGMAKVQVAAVLDFDSVITTTEQYQPTQSTEGDQMLLTESTRAELYRDEAAANDGSGVLEIEVPVPVEEGATAADPAAGDDAVRYSLDERDATFAVDRVVTNAETAVGKVSMLSVAVLLDESTVDAARVVEIERLVQAAAGIETGRGDLLAVTLMPLNEQFRESVELATSPVEAEAAAGLDLMGMIRMVLTGLVAVVVLVFGILMATKGPKSSVVDLDAIESRAVSPDSLLAAGELVDEMVPEERLQNLLENQSDDVADVLRSWLNEAEEVRA